MQSREATKILKMLVVIVFKNLNLYLPITYLNYPRSLKLNKLFLQGLTVTDLEDLLEDIKVYLELEQGKNTEYWRDIVTVTEDELQKLKKLENTRGE